MSAQLILVNDDASLVRQFRYIGGVEYLCHSFTQPAHALRWLWRSNVRPLLSLIRLDPPAVSYTAQEALALVEYLSERYPDSRVIGLYENDGSIAQEAMKKGGHAVLPLPGSSEDLFQIIRAHEYSASPPVYPADPLDRLILGSSAACKNLKERIRQYALSPFPVLVGGPSGAGKELVARGLHLASARADQPFVAVNCSALSPTLFESLLFGHVRGAFTGATDTKAGLVEEAGRGTLFLDEIGEMPLDSQAKLLRLLEDGHYFRVGESKDRHAKARIVAASNRDLRMLVEAGAFRLDLFYRLSVLDLQVPALSDRPEDKHLLWEHYSKLIATDLNIEACRFDSAAASFWHQYSFPGNVRELRNIAIRLHCKYPGRLIGLDQLAGELDASLSVSSSQGSHQVMPLQAGIALSRPNFQLDHALRQWEEALIRSALERADRNISAAARLLGLNRTTLYGRLERLGISATPIK